MQAELSSKLEKLQKKVTSGQENALQEVVWKIEKRAHQFRRKSNEEQFNPFTTVDAIWHLEVITHADICLTFNFVDKYFYAFQHSMRLFWNRHAAMPIGLRLLG